MSSNDSEFESTSTRARKRMLPSVAEIARELSRRTAADAASILTTSRKVCAEELVRIKEGHESVPVDVLVERARLILEHDAETTGGSFAFEPPPPLLTTPSAPAPPLPDGADPFGETMGRLDLRWDGSAMDSSQGQGDGHENLSEPQVSPFESTSPLPDLPPENEPQPPPQHPSAVDPEERFAPQPPPSHRSKLPFFLLVVVLAAGGAAAWYFLSGPSKPAGPPPSLAVKRKPKAGPEEAAAPAAAQPSTPALPATPGWIKSGGVSPAPTGIPAQPTAVPPTKEPAVEKPKAPVEGQAPPTRRAPAVNVAPEPVPVLSNAKPTPMPPVAKAIPGAEASKPLAEKAAPSAPSRKGEKAAPSAMQVQVRAGTLVTPDWAGAPVHVVHFSSFQEKARAEKHAAVLAKELGVPVRAVQVDLGDKGIWYRTVAGEFATPEEALAFRNQLLEKGTPGVGLVYRMTPKK